MFDIQDKVALVTGGASGIGLATTKKLLASGARGVVVADINSDAGKVSVEELGQEYGDNRVAFVKTDVADKKSFEEAFKYTIQKFENFDILVNNAGIYDEVNYEATLAVNLIGTTHGVVLASQNYIPKYRTASEGVIINTASIAATETFAGCPIYGASKSGVVSLTMSLGHSAHYEKTKIKIVAVAPGSTLTNMFNHVRFFNDTCAQINLQLADDNHFQMQQADVVAEAIIEIIREKPSGTVWRCANNQKLSEFTLNVCN